MISDEDIDDIFYQTLLSLWEKEVITVAFKDNKGMTLAFTKENNKKFEELKHTLTDYEMMLVGTVMDINMGLV